MYLLYIFPPELHTFMTPLFNFFNPSKKNPFGCAACRKIWNRKSQRLIRNPTCSSNARWMRSWVRFRIDLDSEKKIKNFCHCQESNPCSSAAQSLPRRITDWAIPDTDVHESLLHRKKNMAPVKRNLLVLFMGKNRCLVWESCEK
jgi:hypothetical protein